MNGPPSSGQQVSTGSRSSAGGSIDHSVTGPDAPRLAPMRISSQATSRAAHSFAGVGGSSVSARSDEPFDQRQWPRAEGELGTAGGTEEIRDHWKDAPLTRVKRSAGPPAAITRR